MVFTIAVNIFYANGFVRVRPVCCRELREPGGDLEMYPNTARAETGSAGVREERAGGNQFLSHILLPRTIRTFDVNEDDGTGESGVWETAKIVTLARTLCGYANASDMT